ncbi:Zn(II)2Cys6 transcription factor domain-containing protein [Aspergillus undulatus]|uniref:Zn(II)2Cys6 transcription factor domain-containing protein n=1 Tax=Aspergillus undulatus TaxID=1810928 RepID=UPI003CCCA9FB
MAPAFAEGFQSTFRVTLPEGPARPVYHARRAHKKSRNGCLICKMRRVKCDERRPTCQRCENYGASCIYPSSPSSASSSTVSPTSSASSRTLGRSPGSQSTGSNPDRTLTSLSVADTIGRVRYALGNDLAFAPRIMGDYDAVLNMAVNSFHFFLSSSTNTVGTPMIQAVMRREMIHVAFDNPYLMYTILGCGILHMNRMSPLNEPREVAEAYFWQRALRLYSRALQTRVDEKNVSALISACMLMGITSLIPQKFSIQDSWVFTSRPSDLNWLAIQGGLATILKVAGKYVPGSIWGVPFAHNHVDESKMFRYEITKGREGLHQGLCDLCGITEDTDDESSPYWYPIKLLTPYLELEPNMQNAALCATWMGRIDPVFVNLCRDRDPRALVILSWWMGLMCSLSEWQPWVEGRVRQECIAVCIYLESMADPVILPFLEYPAAAAGYTLMFDYSLGRSSV